MRLRIGDAITYAANMAELEDYKVEYYGQELSPEELILELLVLLMCLSENQKFYQPNGLADPMKH